MAAALPADALASATLVDVERVLLSRRFREFIPEAWKTLMPAVPFVPGYHIDAMADHLQAVTEGQIKKLIISIAPRHAKSLTVCTFWPSWAWTRKRKAKANLRELTQGNHVRWVFGAFKEALATRDSHASRQLMDSLWYQQRWGCTCQAKPHHESCQGFRFTTDQNTKTLYENDRGGRRLTASVEAGTTGEGGDILVMDDPIDIDSAQSETTRSHTWRYVDTVWRGRLNDQIHGAMVFCGQRTHKEDPSGMLLAEGGWDLLSIPTEWTGRHIVTSLGWKDPRTEVGQLLAPERFGPEQVRTAKRNPIAWAAQHQQDPTTTEGGVFKRTWWRFWCPSSMPEDERTFRGPDGVLRTAEELPETFTRLVQSWDMTFKGITASLKKQKAPDPVCGGVVGLAGRRYYLLDSVCEVMNITETVDAVRAMSEAHPKAASKLVEDAANGPYVMAILREEIGGFIPVTPRGSKLSRVMTTSAMGEDSKDARALAMVDLVSSGYVYLPHPALMPTVWEFIQEHADFPNGAHDDRCLAAGTSIATPFGERPIESINQGDYVLTPTGPRRVLAAGSTGWRACVSVLGLVGTPDHPTYDDVTQRFRPLAEADRQDFRVRRLSGCGQTLWALRNLSSSWARRIASWEPASTTSARVEPTTAGREQSGSTSQYGSSTIAARFLRGISSITLTAIRSTITLPTLNALRRLNIHYITAMDTMRAKWNTLSGSDRWLVLGTEQTLVVSGTGATWKQFGRDESRRSDRAKRAESHSWPTEKPSIASRCVAIRDGQQMAATMSSENVSSAGNSSRPGSRSTHRKLQRHAPDGAGLPWREVFNLKVEGGVYYANGILVHNCDMMSQALAHLQPFAWREQALEEWDLAKNGPPPKDTRELVRRRMDEAFNKSKVTNQAGRSRGASYRRARG
jgi:predicted phage terminase large subunit-like protein